MPGLYNVYNALTAAAAACAVGGADIERIAAGLERFDAAFGRFERLRVGDRDAVLLLAKNPAGANELIRTLAADRPAQAAAAGPQRPHRRRPRHLLDLGRRLRAPGGQRAGGRHRRHAGGRDGAAAQVRRGRGEAADRRRRHRRGARPVARGRRGARVPARHLHRDARAARGARRGGASCARTGRRHDRPARLPPLPRAPEHLRRPRQHRRAAGALRVARHRLCGHRLRAGRPAGRRRPVLRRRRPGPRPAADRGRPRGAGGRPAIGHRRRRLAARRCAAAIRCSATTTAAIAATRCGARGSSTWSPRPARRA